LQLGSSEALRNSTKIHQEGSECLCATTPRRTRVLLGHCLCEFSRSFPETVTKSSGTMDSAREARQTRQLLVCFGSTLSDLEEETVSWNLSNCQVSAG
jgi:hypothetical protein